MYSVGVTLSRELHRLSLTLLAVVAVTAANGSPAHAQTGGPSADIRAFLAEIGPRWAATLDENISRTLQIYETRLTSSPKDGVTVTRDVAYGPDPRHKLDVVRRQASSGAPIVVFLHGGAFVTGERQVNSEIYGNVAMYFARQGFVAVNATYRLAPAAPWPAGAEDVGALVRWLREHPAAHGGDVDRIYLIGHSAGAAHVASYALMPSMHGKGGPGLAGIVLMSGRYRVEARADDPRARNVRAYFGADPARYAERSPLTYVPDAPRLPVHIVIAEYDNPGLDTQGALLLAALCQRDGACPRFTRLPLHNHLSMVAHFNTEEDALGREIVEFIRRGR